ncbi:tetratricopeptide repeat protein [Dyadobacter psychrophilus]|uniref:TolB amino-terminal domain-containing protein n=1 Tax=Dyadobacter psychrophilus TaxID=651661 RepID=A0A1T5DBG0_9BACT|nr:AraC family transcriptional regulator [Dyadobacter psychrophilus]SKB69054.1 TolB amino-terminal domain-containing protein [Dyadobacter psychrophilus]
MKPSIAVLPFVNLSNDPEEEYFSDGVTEEIINVLSRVPGLQVAGRTSSFTFKGRTKDLKWIGEQLNVKHILQGSIRNSGDRLLVDVQLVLASDDSEVWSEHYDRELDDIFDIQDEIALAILSAIKVQLLGEEPTGTFKRYTNNKAAYQLYLRGRFYHNKFAGPDAYQKAIGYFESAIALDPTYAIAYAGIASCYLNMWFYRHLPAAKALPLMKQATGQALALDNGIAESYLALARMQMLNEWDFASAAASFAKALELHWNAADLLSQHALYLALSDKYAQAEEQTAVALSLEPFSLINNFYAAYVYWIAGNFEKAVEQGQKLVALEPSFWGGHLIIGLNLITLKNFPEAQEALENALEINYNGITLSACGVLFGLSDETESARDILTQMISLSKNQVVANYDMGIVHASIGEVNEALGYFQAAIDQHEPPMLFFKFIVRDWLTESGQDLHYKPLIDQIIK